MPGTHFAVSCKIRDVLLHQGNANERAEDPGYIAAACFAHDGTMIKQHTRHHPCSATAFCIEFSSLPTVRAW